jgi:hypothetical protein
MLPGWPCNPSLRGGSAHPFSDPAVFASDAFCGAAACGITVVARLELELAVRGLSTCRCSTELFNECMFP